VTVGNSLRRILLSSLEGSAVTQIKVHGAQHEFSSLPGVVEDVTDIVLNVKSLVVKNHSEQTRVVRIEKNSKGPITGADVRTDEQAEVINKDPYGEGWIVKIKVEDAEEYHTLLSNAEYQQILH